MNFKKIIILGHYGVTSASGFGVVGVGVVGVGGVGGSASGTTFGISVIDLFILVFTVFFLEVFKVSLLYNSCSISAARKDNSYGEMFRFPREPISYVLQQKIRQIRRTQQFLCFGRGIEGLFSYIISGLISLSYN